MQSASAVNGLQERTGQSGSLESSEYYIHCQAYPTPSYKLNYLASSCAVRLKDETCNHFGCPRFTGRVREVKVYKVPPQGKKNGRPKMKNRKLKCVECGKKVIPKARHLCSVCYGFHAWAGTLFNFPTTAEIKELQRGEHENTKTKKM